MRVSPDPGRRLRFIKLEPAHRPYKKWKAYFEDADKTQYVRYFGGKYADGKNYPDYTLSGDDQATDAKRDLYRKRHNKEKVSSEALAKEHNDELYLVSPGLLSLVVLWGDSHSIKENIKEFKSKYLNSNFLKKE